MNSDRFQGDVALEDSFGICSLAFLSRRERQWPKSSLMKVIFVRLFALLSSKMPCRNFFLQGLNGSDSGVSFQKLAHLLCSQEAGLLQLIGQEEDLVPMLPNKSFGFPLAFSQEFLDQKLVLPLLDGRLAPSVKISARRKGLPQSRIALGVDEAVGDMSRLAQVTLRTRPAFLEEKLLRQASGKGDVNRCQKEAIGHAVFEIRRFDIVSVLAIDPDVFDAEVLRIEGGDDAMSRLVDADMFGGYLLPSTESGLDETEGIVDLLAVDFPSVPEKGFVEGRLDVDVALVSAGPDQIIVIGIFLLVECVLPAEKREEVADILFPRALDGENLSQSSFSPKSEGNRIQIVAGSQDQGASIPGLDAVQILLETAHDLLFLVQKQVQLVDAKDRLGISFCLGEEIVQFLYDVRRVVSEDKARNRRVPQQGANQEGLSVSGLPDKQDSSRNDDSALAMFLFVFVPVEDVQKLLFLFLQSGDVFENVLVHVFTSLVWLEYKGGEKEGRGPVSGITDVSARWEEKSRNLLPRALFLETLHIVFCIF